MVSYAPYFISTVVMCGIILQFLQARGGLINLLLNLIGIESKNWITYPSAFRHIYVWSGVWQSVGYNSIIYIAALSSVSMELHEAALVDGANILQRIWHVDIPSVMPTFCVLLIIRCGNIMNVGFQKVLLLQNNLNLRTSEIISTYAYNIGLNSSGSTPQYSYGTAIGLFTSVVNLILLVIVNKIIKKLSGSGLCKETRYMRVKIKVGIRYTRGDKIFLTIDWILLVIFFVIILYPLLFIFVSSISAGTSYMRLSLVPKNFHWKAIRRYSNTQQSGLVIGTH